MSWGKQWTQKDFDVTQIIDTYYMLKQSNILAHLDCKMLFSIDKDFCKFYLDEETVGTLQRFGRSYYKCFSIVLEDLSSALLSEDPEKIWEMYFMTEDIMVPQDLEQFSLQWKDGLSGEHLSILSAQGYLTHNISNEFTNIEFIRLARLILRHKWSAFYRNIYSVNSFNFEIAKLGNKVSRTIHAYEDFDIVTSTTLKGRSNICGSYRGEVYVLHNRNQYVTEKPDLKNKILVVPNARPDLVDYFAQISAFITDEGGVTSHAAQVAMGMNIPCIVGTHDATTLLKTGDIVEMNLDTGEVTRV